MEQFKKISLDDRAILMKYLNMNKHLACDYSIGNLILWSEVNHTQFAIAEDRLLIKFIKNKTTYFAFPLGNGDLKKAFDWLQAYCTEQNIEFNMSLIEPEMFENIEKIYPGEYQVTYSRDLADYIYKTDDLINLIGKKYHSKRNHINKFMEINADWSYETITGANQAECIEMVKEWCIQNECHTEKSKAEELCVLIKGLKNMFELDLTGGIIRAAGRIVALTLGEKLNDDTFVIHFEKAFANVQGAYPMINQQFIKHELSEYAFVNREEDMGKEGLRKAKQSYYPVFMAEKGELVKKIL